MDSVFVRFRGLESSEVQAALESTFGSIASADWNEKRGQGVIRFEQAAALEKALSAGTVSVGEGSAKLELYKKGGKKEENGEEKAGDKNKRKKKKRNGGEEKKKKESKEEDTSSQDEKDAKAVYVSGLPEGADRDAVKELFAAFGEIRTVEFKARKKSRRPTPVHAFVHFKETSSAIGALAAHEKQPLKLGDVELKVEPKKPKQPQNKSEKATTKDVKPAKEVKKQNAPKTTVYLSNFDLSEEELTSKLAGFGSIVKVTMRSREPQATVTFKEAADAEASISKGAETPFTLNGASIKVEASRLAGKNKGKTLHLAGFGEQAPSEEQVRALFQGEIELVRVRPARKFALVTFSEESAVQAVLDKAKEEALDIPASGDEKLVVELSEGKPRRGGSSRNRRARKPKPEDQADQ